VGIVNDKAHAISRQVEGIMATMIFVSLCVAAEGFLLYCLFHFGQELRHEPRSGSDDDLWIASPKLNVVPLQLVGPASIAIWSEGTWDRILSITDDSESGDVKDKDAAKEHYDAAA
jgi:hypothetical protein